MKKIAIILYGPPGSGKGTQANLLAAKLGMVHFDSGRFLESIIHDPARAKEKQLKRERMNFEKGRLMTPSFVLKEVSKKIEQIGGAGWSLVSSGSPRTMYEAKHELPILEKIYGKKNIFVFVLTVRPDISVVRNSRRLLCASCGTPLLTDYYPSKNPKFCPACGGKLYRRTLDNPKTIRIRVEEYKKRTQPIIDLMRARGYVVKMLNGELPPYKVFEHMLRDITRRQRK